MALRQGAHAAVELACLPYEESVMAWDQAVLVTMFLQGLRAITGPDQVVGRDSELICCNSAESSASHCLACLPAHTGLSPSTHFSVTAQLLGRHTNTVYMIMHAHTPTSGPGQLFFTCPSACLCPVFLAVTYDCCSGFFLFLCSPMHLPVLLPRLYVGSCPCLLPPSRGCLFFSVSVARLLVPGLGSLNLYT